MHNNYWLLGVAALNMIVSLYYYLRIVKAVFIDKSETAAERITVTPYTAAAMIICTAGILLIGFSGQVFDYINAFFLPHH